MPLTASVERVFYFSARVLKSLFKAAFGPATVDEGKERLTERVSWRMAEGERRDALKRVAYFCVFHSGQTDETAKRAAE